MERKETKTSSLPSHPALSGNSSWVISRGSYCQWSRYGGVNYRKDLRQVFIIKRTHSIRKFLCPSLGRKGKDHQGACNFKEK